MTLAVPLMSSSSGLTIFHPWTMKVLADNALGSVAVEPVFEKALRAFSIGVTPLNLLKVVVAANLVFFVLNNAVSAALICISSAGSTNPTHNLARDIFMRLQSRSLDFHGKSQVRELMARDLNDSLCVRQFLEGLLFASGVVLRRGQAGAPCSVWRQRG